jgi:hypothetical protein
MNHPDERKGSFNFADKRVCLFFLQEFNKEEF